MKNNLRPLRRRKRAARPPLRLVRASTSHASRCPSDRSFHAADNRHISVRARRWSGVVAFLRARASCFLVSMSPRPGAPDAALAASRNLTSFHKALSLQSSVGRPGALAPGSAPPKPFPPSPSNRIAHHTIRHGCRAIHLAEAVRASLTPKLRRPKSSTNGSCAAAWLIARFGTG